MKRLLIFIIAIITVFTLASCDSGEETPKTVGGLQVPDGATVYEGQNGEREITVVLFDGKGWLAISEKSEMPPEMMAQNGLTGTLYGVMTLRYELSSAVVSDGVLTLSDAEATAYQSTSFSGTAASAYLKKMKAQYEEAYKKEQVTKEEYDRVIALLNGKETPVSEMSGSITATVKLDGKKKTCLLLGLTTVDSKGIKNTVEYEYTSDGKIAKVFDYSLYSAGHFMNPRLEVTTYYPDGKTVKMEEEFDVDINEDDGSVIVGESPIYRCEFREDGTKSVVTNWHHEGKLSSIIEYDEYDRIIKETQYRLHVDAPEYYLTYNYGETTVLIDRYENDRLVMKTLREKDEENPDSDPRWWNVTECTIYDPDGTKTVRTYYPGAQSEYNGFKDCRKYDENGVETYYATYDEEGNVIEEYVDGELVGGDTGDELPEDYEMSYENQGMTWTAHYASGVLWKETVTFTDGTTITVRERDSLGRYVISYGYYAGDDGVMTILEVYHYVYTGDAIEPTSQSWVQYNVPDGAVLDMSDNNTDNGGNDSSDNENENAEHTEIYELRGTEWREYYVYGNCVKITVKFTNGETVCIKELDELGRVKIMCGYSLDENEEIDEILVSYFTYVGDTDQVKSEKMTEYDFPDGTVLREQIIEH